MERAAPAPGELTILLPYLDEVESVARCVGKARTWEGSRRAPCRRCTATSATRLSGIGRLFFRSPVGDLHCGLRRQDRGAPPGAGT